MDFRGHYTHIVRHAITRILAGYSLVVACGIPSETSGRDSIRATDAGPGTISHAPLPGGRADGSLLGKCKGTCRDKLCGADDGCGRPCARVPPEFHPSLKDNFDMRAAAQDGGHFDCRQGHCGCGANEADNDNMECQAKKEGNTWKGYCAVNCPGACVFPPLLPADGVIKNQLFTNGFTQGQMYDWATKGIYPGEGVEKIACVQIFKHYNGGEKWNGDRPRPECLPIGN